MISLAAIFNNYLSKLTAITIKNGNSVFMNFIKFTRSVSFNCCHNHLLIEVLSLVLNLYFQINKNAKKIIIVSFKGYLNNFSLNIKTLFFIRQANFNSFNQESKAI